MHPSWVNWADFMHTVQGQYDNSPCPSTTTIALCYDSLRIHMNQTPKNDNSNVECPAFTHDQFQSVLTHDAAERKVNAVNDGI